MTFPFADRYDNLFEYALVIRDKFKHGKHMQKTSGILTHLSFYISSNIICIVRNMCVLMFKFCHEFMCMSDENFVELRKWICGVLYEPCIIPANSLRFSGFRVGAKHIDEIHSDPDRKWKRETYGVKSLGRSMSWTGKMVPKSLKNRVSIQLYHAFKVLNKFPRSDVIELEAIRVGAKFYSRLCYSTFKTSFRMMKNVLKMIIH